MTTSGAPDRAFCAHGGAAHLDPWGGMGLIKLAELFGVRPVAAEAAPADRDACEFYLLVHDPPGRPWGTHGTGWTLSAWRSDRCSWSAPLADRGAGPLIGPRVAQAVAVRVLSEHHVDVAGWVREASAELTTYRACLHP